MTQFTNTWLLTQINNQAYPILVRPLNSDNAKSDGRSLVTKLGLKNKGESALAVGARLETILSAFKRKAVSNPKLREFYDIPDSAETEDDLELPSELYLGFMCNPDDPANYEHSILCFVRADVNGEFRVLPWASQGELPHQPVSVYEARRKFDQLTGISTSLHQSIPPEPMPPTANSSASGTDDLASKLMAFMRMEFDQCKQSMRTDLGQQITRPHERFDPIEHNIKNLQSQHTTLQQQFSSLQKQNLDLQKQINELQGNTGTVQIQSTCIAPALESPCSPTLAESIKRQLNKISNPAAFDIKLVERTVSGDSTLRLNAFRPSECYKDETYLAVGNGQQLLVRNPSVARFKSISELQDAARNYLEILQVWGKLEPADVHIYITHLVDIAVSYKDIQSAAKIHNIRRVRGRLSLVM